LYGFHPTEGGETQEKTFKCNCAIFWLIILFQRSALKAPGSSLGLLFSVLSCMYLNIF
jgi:hypothetical protein